MRNGDGGDLGTQHVDEGAKGDENFLVRLSQPSGIAVPPPQGPMSVLASLDGNDGAISHVCRLRCFPKSEGYRLDVPRS